MAVYSKTGLLREAVFELAEAAVRKIDDFTAIRANQVMVVSGGTPHKIAAAAMSGMSFADEPQFREYFQRAVNGDQANVRVLQFDTLMNSRRSQMLMRIHNFSDNGTALGGDLITVMP